MISKKMQTLYENILAYAAMSADSDGYISAGVGVASTVPALVSTKIDNKDGPKLRLIMPTQANLRSDQTGKLIFHPLAENAISDMSPTTSCLRKNITTRINFMLGNILSSLLSLAASPDLHHKLTPEQLEVVVMLKTIDDSIVSTFVNIVMAGIKSADAERLFVNVFVRRGGTYKGARYTRVGVTTFTMYNDLLKDPDELYGVKLRAKDREAFKALFEFVFPGIKEPDQYNFGSNDKTAPWLHSLMLTTGLIAGRINDIVTEFKEYIDHADDMLFNSEWVEDFQALETFEVDIKRVPFQHKPGMISEEVSETVTKPAGPGYQIASNTVQQPNRYIAPNISPINNQPNNGPRLQYDEKGRLDFRSVMASNPSIAAAASQANMYTGVNMGGGYPGMNVKRSYSGGGNNGQYDNRYPMQQGGRNQFNRI